MFWLLGFIPAKADSVVVLLCRQPCAAQNTLKVGSSGPSYSHLPEAYFSILKDMSVSLFTFALKYHIKQELRI